MRYIRFILQQLRILVLVLWSALWVYRVKVYPNRVSLWENRHKPVSEKVWYWKYADTYEHGFSTDERNYINSFYGVYELLKDENGDPDYAAFKLLSEKEKKRLSVKWGVWRNGYWNGIIYEAPKDDKKFNIKFKRNSGGAGHWAFRNKKYHGVQWVTWEDAKGKGFFRFSFTKKFIFGLHINVQSGTGASGNRNNFKLRIFKYEPDRAKRK